MPIARRNTSSASARAHLDDLDSHRIIMLSDSQVPQHLQNRSWLIDAGRNGSGPREAYFKVNNILGLVRACSRASASQHCRITCEENNRLSSCSASPIRSSSTPISSIPKS